MATSPSLPWPFFRSRVFIDKILQIPRKLFVPTCVFKGRPQQGGRKSTTTRQPTERLPTPFFPPLPNDLILEPVEAAPKKLLIGERKLGNRRVVLSLDLRLLHADGPGHLFDRDVRSEHSLGRAAAPAKHFPSGFEILHAGEISEVKHHLGAPRVEALRKFHQRPGDEVAAVLGTPDRNVQRFLLDHRLNDHQAKKRAPRGNFYRTSFPVRAEYAPAWQEFRRHGCSRWSIVPRLPAAHGEASR